MRTGRLRDQLRNKKILITGGDGFLGSHLIPEMKKVCNHITLYRKDVRNIGSFRKSYDIICHLAALNKTDSNGSASRLFDVNVNGTLEVMRYCLRAGAKCVFASSAAVYKPITNKRRLSENSSIEPVSLYGVSKMLAEKICEYQAKNFGLSVIALRIFNMYGPRQEAPFLIPYVMHQLFKDEPILLRSPDAARDFVYITDVVKAFISSCGFKHEGFLALNVGTGQNLSVYKLVERIALRMGSKYQIKKVGMNRSKKDYVTADISNISKILNWSPIVSIDGGLQKTLML